MANVLAAIIEPKLAAKGQRPEDGVPDMTAISDIDVKGVNTNLKVRFKRSEIYTYTGTILVAVNPYEFFKIYEPETMQMYAGKKMGDMPPHVFATAQAAYMNIQNGSQNQSCVISGESGAGKTETTKFILQYLCTITSTVSNWVEQQILECNTILEAFGNARTVRNDNSSRFGKFMQVCFSEDVEIKGMIVQEYLLEQSRITFQAMDERNYHVFYQLVKGGDKDEFLLESPQKYAYLNQSGCYECKGVDDARQLDELRMALTVLNIEDDLQSGIFSLVSAVLLCGNLEFRDVDGETVQLTSNDKKIVGKMARLLAIDEAGLLACVVSRTIIVRGQSTVIPLKLSDATENKHAMAKALYSRTFTWLVDRINRTTNPGQNTSKFIGVLDIFGFENFATNSFEQLCINFTNEKLHKFFNHYVFALEQAEYEREEIDFAHIQFTDNTVCLELIEKAPMCVLKLLDEECKIPKGSDKGYLEKQHSGLAQHPHYFKSSDPGRWGEVFGIKHFAGRVEYTVQGFLKKNKDTDQGALFELMRDSSKTFVQDVTRFQDMLSVERNMIAGARAGARTSTLSRNKSMTNKAKPTVGDTFRRQLQQLVDILETTTPWYVRCIKPNSDKKAKLFEDQLVTDQLNYSGMLDIVRIRREGFPVHVPAQTFVSKYAAMAQVMNKRLSSDPKQAAAEILTYIKAPRTEWQIGKTKIFLRNSVFEPLEEKLKELLYDKVVIIQKWWRMYRARKRFLLLRRSVVKIQAAVVGATRRLMFVRRRSAAIRIQTWWRGVRAREYVKALRIKRRKEMEARKKREREEKEKRQREMGEALMEDSFLAAQKEMYAIAKSADAKASQANRASQGQQVNLDKMFSMLADDSGKADADVTKKVEADLDALFAGKTPTGTVAIKRGDGTRTIRRKRRIQKKIEEVEAQESNQPPAEELFNPADYPMIRFADEHFNQWPKGGGTLSRRRSSGTIKQNKPITDPMPKTEMLQHMKNLALPTSMVHLHNPANVVLACSMYKDLNKYLRNELKQEQVIQNLQSVVAYCIEIDELRNEIYCQLMKMATNNPDPDEQTRAWQAINICCASFPPSKNLYRYLQAFIKTYEKDQIIGSYAMSAMVFLKKLKFNGIRRMAPSQVEIEAISAQQPIICRFYFLDGKAKAVGVQPSWTSSDVILAIAGKIGLKATAGWALFESTPQAEHFIRNHEYIGDILAEWEADKRSSMKMSKYTTVSRKGATQALGLGDAKFVFRKRLFLNPREIPTDPEEYRLLYFQAVHSTVRVDDFPVDEAGALMLAGLQAQVTFGDADKSMLSRYERIDGYLPWRIHQSRPQKTQKQWMEKLFHAHDQYGRGNDGSGLSTIKAMIMYLTMVKRYPQYGGTCFDVQYKGFWSFPNRLLLSIDVEGFKFIHLFTKEILDEYPYSALKSVAVNAFEETITLNMNEDVADVGNFMFLCPRKDDVANLIASYSPKHRNWKQVGLARVNTKKATEEEKAKNMYDVTNARAQLVRSGMLLPPPEAKSSFTTLRRKSSRSQGLDSEDAAFPRAYWSYSKAKLTQPLSIMHGPETETIALRTFISLLIFAGIVKEGGFEETEDSGHVLLVQTVIGKCLEKEDVCNELYLQLVKQTTDQPDANSKINQQNWRFLVLLLGVVVPRNKLLLSYIAAHLRRCAADPDTEEGKYAQFAQQCMSRTLENKNRKYPPSKVEMACVVKRSPIYSRFYFMDGEFRAMMFDAASTTQEVVAMVKERIGLPSSVQGFSLFEVFGSLERNMLPWEKVADAIFKWEKYGRKVRSPTELHLTFKKRLFLGPFTIPKNQTEFDLTLFQAIDDVKCDRHPITLDEASQLVALHAQMELGNWEPTTSYEGLIESFLPRHIATAVDPGEIAANHRKLDGRDVQQCKRLYLKFVMSWPLYGSTIFEVIQSYTTALPKSLWLAINEEGVHIMRRRTKKPLITYPYRSIVNYSPSLRNLMIVTESLTRGTKYVFTTNQASQIAHLIKDYTTIIMERMNKSAPGGGNASAKAKRGADKRKSGGDESFGFGTPEPGGGVGHMTAEDRRNSGTYGFDI